MELTVFGIAQLVFGVILLLFARPRATLVLLLVSSLFTGAASAYATALGHSSIPPAQFALLFVVAQIFLPGAGQMIPAGHALRSNLWLVVFVLYGLLAAVIGPRIFAHALNVAPMRMSDALFNGNPTHDAFAAEPLRPTSQNMTTSIYLLGTLITSIVTYVICSTELGWRRFVRVAAIIGCTHAVLGLVSIAFPTGPVRDFFDVFRNGNYAQLNQTVEGISRMSGISAEPSDFSAFGIAWLAFNFECWLRRVDSRWTGAATIFLALALSISTSTTAYFGLTIYAAIVIVRSILFPPSMPAQRFLILLVGSLLITSLVIGSMILTPEFATKFGKVVHAMTLGKSNSYSYLQRAFWSRQGIDAFMASYGLGIGPGSFRSSGIGTAILGSVGIVGTFAFVGHLGLVFKPFRATTWMHSPIEAERVGEAAAWAAIVVVLSAMASVPGCDPGINFGFLSGCALALRGRRSGTRASLPAGATGVREPPVRGMASVLQR